MKLGSRFSISAYGAGFSVLHFSLWSLVLGSPSNLVLNSPFQVMEPWVLSSLSLVMKLGAQFSSSAYGSGFLVLHLK